MLFRIKQRRIKFTNLKTRACIEVFHVNTYAKTSTREILLGEFSFNLILHLLPHATWSQDIGGVKCWAWFYSSSSGDLLKTCPCPPENKWHFKPRDKSVVFWEGGGVGFSSSRLGRKVYSHVTNYSRPIRRKRQFIAIIGPSSRIPEHLVAPQWARFNDYN